jgi:cellobiose-specific phosphotransferase system component IIB
MIKKLVAFDFDGTLSDSPMPDEGKKIWKTKKGVDYSHKGWWGRVESLDNEVFNITMFKGILDILEKEILNDETYVIILTSRMEKLRPQVEKILKDCGVHVDKIDMKRSNKTKGEKILRYTKEFPHLREICVYDDKDSEIKVYQDIVSELPWRIDFKIFLADKGKVTQVKTNNKLLTIIWSEIRKLVKK